MNDYAINAACLGLRGNKGGPFHPALELKGSPDGHRTGQAKILKVCIGEDSVSAMVFGVNHQRYRCLNEDFQNSPHALEVNLGLTCLPHNLQSKAWGFD